MLSLCSARLPQLRAPSKEYPALDSTTCPLPDTAACQGGRCLELLHPPQPLPISTALQPTEAEGSLCKCGTWTSPASLPLRCPPRAPRGETPEVLGQ